MCFQFFEREQYIFCWRIYKGRQKLNVSHVRQHNGIVANANIVSVTCFHYQSFKARHFKNLYDIFYTELFKHSGMAFKYETVITLLLNVDEMYLL